MKKHIINVCKIPLASFCIHWLLFFTFYCILSFLGLIKGYPTNESLMQWDAGWYESIVENGFSYNPDQQSNIAFFPLFPLIWKITSFSPVLISVLNLIFMMSGMLILYKTFQIKSIQIFLLLLSIPSLFFCYVPYSEALFFFSGSLIIYGLKNNNWIAVLGIFLAGMTRSVSLIFIPVILFSKLYNYHPDKNNAKLIKETSFLVLSSIVSLLLAQYVQYRESGIFFAIFKAQMAWNRLLGLPKLFLTTWDEGRLIWLDGSAFLAGLVSTYYCLSLLFKKLKSKQKTVSSGFLFSVAYLAVVTITTLVYSGEDALGGTTIYSLNRFVFATPFFLTFLFIVLKGNRIHRKMIVNFLIMIVITGILFNMFGNLHYLDTFVLPFFKTIIYFAVMFLYSFLYLLIIKTDIRKNLWLGIYLCNLFLQIYLFNAFINGIWIG